MINKIEEILKENQVENYLINISKKESAQLYFIKKKLDMRRAENTESATVMVYRDFEKDGKKLRGNASFTVEPSNTRDEIDQKVKRAYLSATFVTNPFYEIAPEVKSDMVLMETAFSDMSLEDMLKEYVQAMYEMDQNEDAFINSSEFYALKKVTRIVNSNGVDVSFTNWNVNGEFVVQCTAPQDVETHQAFDYDSLDTKGFKELVQQTITLTKDRAYAKDAPKAGEYDIILSDDYVKTIFEFYGDRANGSYIYQQYSDFKVGEVIQGNKDEVKGELLNINYLPTEPFSSEGIRMKKLSCVEDGIFSHISTGCRFASYLEVEPTGEYEKLEVQPGKVSFEDMKKQKGLHVVNFSDFQMDSLGGYFGGEIRLAYLNDGTKIIPVTGGSINGSILEAQKTFIFSKEVQETSSFKGPKAIMLKNISVAGSEE